MKKTSLIFAIIFFVGILSPSLAYADTNEIKIIINEQPIKFEDDPIIIEDDSIIIEDEILVPAETIFNELGLEVYENNENGTITVYRNYFNDSIIDLVIEIKVGNSVAKVNENEIQLDVPVQSFKNKVFVPIKFICESINAEYKWNKDTSTAVILYEQEKIPEKDIQILKDSIYNLLTSAGVRINNTSTQKIVNLFDEEKTTDIFIDTHGIYPNEEEDFEKSITRQKVRITDKLGKREYEVTESQYIDDLAFSQITDDEDILYLFNLSSNRDLEILDYLSNVYNLSLGNNMFYQIDLINDVINLFNIENTQIERLDSGEIKYTLLLNKEQIENEYYDTYLTNLSHYDVVEYTVSAIIDENGNLILLKISNINENNSTDTRYNLKKAVSNQEIKFEYDIYDYKINKLITEFNKEHTPILIPDPALEKAIKHELFENVIDEFMQDPENVTREMIDEAEKIFTRHLTDSDLEKITTLKIYEDSIDEYEIVDLEGIQYLKNLEELEICNQSINDISVLKNLPNLKRLKLSGNNIKDVTILKNLTNLNYLDLSLSFIEDITPLKDLTNLNYLDLSDNIIEDVTPLKDLANLNYLDLSGNFIEDMTPLKNLTNLETLLIGFNYIKDMSALSNLSNLTSLWIYKNNIEDIEPLSNLAKLENLLLSYNEIEDIEPLRNLLNLKYLWISDNKISNLAPLSNLISLEELDISNNEIQDIDALKDLINITKLFLSGNNVNSMEPISNLTNLKGLEIINMMIEDLSFLSDLTNLESLFISDNEIKDITPISNLVNLKQLNIESNNITDFSILDNLINTEIVK